MRANKMLTLLFLVVIAVCSGLRAQTVDEIVNKHIDAMGGKDKLKGLKTMYTEGVMEVHGQEIPVKLWVVNGEAFRTEFEVMGINNIQVVTRDGGWMQMPIMQSPDPKPMDSGMVHSMQGRLNITGELFGYKDRGRKITLEGKETINGVDAYKLKVVDPSGAVILVYVDANTYYVDRTTIHIKAQGQETDLDINYSDYKKIDGGFIYPATVTQEQAGTKVSVTKAEANKPIDDNIFAMPKK